VTPSRRFRPRLGDILLDRGWVTQEQLGAADTLQRESGGAFGTILLEMKFVTTEQLHEALVAQNQHVPEIGANELATLPEDASDLLPETLARRFNVIAISKDEAGVLTLAMEDPFDLAALDVLSQFSGCRIEPVKAPPADIVAAVDACYGTTQDILAEEQQSLEEISLEVEQADPIDSEAMTNATDLLAIAEETPVVRFVEVLFREATQKRASDIHLEPGEQTTNVRLRVDGVLQRLLTVSARMHPAIVSRIKILSGLNIAERRLPQDGRCRLKLPGKNIDIRVSTLPTVHGEKVVMRLLDKSQSILDLDSLGFVGIDLQRFKEALQASYGMILLTGPTGSGKTTSLYAGLTFMDRKALNVITVEDPVEYELEEINQVQVRPDIGLTFARCLRHILRQDPNVIMIGEMRDLETTQIAVRAALTGHLVVSTLHANSAPAVVSRLVDIGIPYYLIIAALNLAIAQRLIRRLCPECKEQFSPSSDLLEKLGAAPPIEGPLTFCRPVGCEECDYLGYKGRLGVYEVMPLSKRLRKIIVNGGSEAELRAAAREEGMKTLYEQAVLKVYGGQTSVEEALSAPQDEEGI
jgi:type IV pilus assembly protein PilB